ncbi:50S ribosomal protein L28 [Caldanaerobacter sp.]|jgi:large subunit ribosomal protein L28|uniref:50S ribosomal protein L28 n=1 Tax=Caldanaerobacter sp. TaxID=2930036 RepID=UPI003C74910F
MPKCDICGKGSIRGFQYSHSNRRTIRRWKPNIRKVRAIVDGTPVTLNVCAKCLKAGKVQRAL